MAKEIANGVDRIVDNINQRALEQSHSQWRSLKNKVDSLLINSNVMKIDNIRKKCQELDDMTHEERIACIVASWGRSSLSQVEPLLQQLNLLEKSLQ